MLTCGRVDGPLQHDGRALAEQHRVAEPQRRRSRGQLPAVETRSCTALNSVDARRSASDNDAQQGTRDTSTR
jgi:hypothetical protein